MAFLYQNIKNNPASVTTFFSWLPSVRRSGFITSLPNKYLRPSSLCRCIFTVRRILPSPCQKPVSSFTRTSNLSRLTLFHHANPRKFSISSVINKYVVTNNPRKDEHGNKMTIDISQRAALVCAVSQHIFL